MNDNPWLLLFMTGAGAYVASLWWSDLQASRKGRGAASVPTLPGATASPARALWIAAFGASVILAAETYGEIVLGLSDQQSKMSVLFGCYTLVAAIIEEVIFRGYIVVEKRGRAALWGGVLAASLFFALLHPFLWKWEDEGFELTLNAKGWFSFGAVFVSSLWFYVCRFSSWNPNRSLLPCFAAHMTKNLGVFAIKAAQGFVVGLW